MFGSRGDTLTCPPADGCRKEKANTSPPRGWPFQEMFCKTGGPFTLLPHALSLSDSVEETGIQTQMRWFFGDTSLPSSRSAGFPNKVVFPASAPRLRFISLSCGAQSELGLGNTRNMVKIPYFSVRAPGEKGRGKGNPEMVVFKPDMQDNSNINNTKCYGELTMGQP